MMVHDKETQTQTQTQTQRQTLEQKRALFSLGKIKVVKEKKDKTLEGQYASWAQKLPVLILTNGLGQTLVFLKAKGEGKAKDERDGKPAKAQKMLFEDLSAWLKEAPTIPWGEKNDPDILQRIVNTSSEVYRIATMEAIAFLTWHKRFAEGYLEKPEEGQ